MILIKKKEKKKMEWFLIVSLLLHLFSHFVYSKANELNCHFDYEGLCIKTVTRFLDKGTLEENREFIIYYTDTKAEIIADYGLINGSYSCRGSKGFVCEKQPSLNFTIVVNCAVKCITAGEFIFDEAHKPPISCKIPANRGDASDNSNDTNKGQNTGGHGLAIGFGIGAVFLLIGI